LDVATAKFSTGAVNISWLWNISAEEQSRLVSLLFVPAVNWRNIMMMRNKFVKALGLSTVALGLAVGSANAGTETGNAQVVVLSTITMTETAALDFGTIAAFADDATNTNVTLLTMPADGSGSSVSWPAGDNGDSNIVVITEGNPGSFAVTGAAPNTVLTLTLQNEVDLSDPSGTSSHEFTFLTTGVYMTLNGSGNTFTQDTDATGAMEFNVGGTIQTVDTGMTAGTVLVPYDDATYTGTYEVVVSY